MNFNTGLKKRLVIRLNKEHKILIIDEDIILVQFLQKLLMPLGYKVYSTSNPRKALHMLDTIDADIIFIDDKLSGLSPIDLLTINKVSSPNSIRFLTSSCPDLETIIAAFNSKLIYQYLAKPLNENNIIEILQEAFKEKESQENKERYYNYCKQLELDDLLDVNLQDSENNSTMDSNERRRYFRLRTFVPLCSDMRILQIKGKVVDTPFTKICVLDLSGGGFRFLSELKLPISSEVVLEFQTNILDHKLLLIGHIVRMDIVEDHIYDYGVEFQVDEGKKSQLIRLLNEMQIDIRNNKAIRGCSFCTKSNQIKCLKARLGNDQ